jgi:uncharacterized protein YndB with AHSA1/START domain
MVVGSSDVSATADRDIGITRVFDAPRELVFDVWTDPKHVAQWWGPRGFTNTVQEMDVRPGGIWRLMMHGPDGVDYPNKIVYIEVVRPERLVYWHGDDDDNETTRFHVTVTFDDEGGKTKLTMRVLFATAAQRDQVAEEHGAVDGMKQTMDRLEEYLQAEAR